MKKEELKREWQTKIALYEASGKNQSKWCRENGVNQRNFNRWYNKLKVETSPVPTIQGWVPIQIAERYPASPLTLEIGKVRLDVQEGFNPSLLAEVVKVLGTIC
jgi:transposase-like protein